MSSQKYKVLVVGCWHLGSVVGSAIAATHHEVYFWDQNPKIRDSWLRGIPPIHEPGLTEWIRPHFNENLFWATDLESLTPTLDWVVLAYDTPINEKDEVLLDSVFEGVEEILSHPISNETRFLFTSQLPVGTSRKIREKIQTRFPDWRGNVLYQPENLRLGEAISSIKNPDRVALGFDSEFPAAQTLLESEFRNLFHLPETPIDKMSLESAEMVKHALNAYLATCVVFGNELSEICEKSGANAWDVAMSLKKDSRVGKKAPLFPGLAFSGGTLARDVKTLSTLEKDDRNFFSHLYTSNENRNAWVIEQLKNNLKTLSGKTILLLGMTYKAGTSTVRRSPALQIAQLLKRENAKVLAIDPLADLEGLTLEERQNLPITLYRDSENHFEKADAVVLVTDWPEFKNWDWKALKTKQSMSLLIDTKNFIKDLSRHDWKRIVPGVPTDVPTEVETI